MNDKKEWILIDTETNGITSPIYVVDLAAQKMVGWEPEGPPFQLLLNQNVDIPPEASRINGYTREILERDGVSAQIAYDAFREYVGERSIVSYNLAFDWDRVLLPEWERLGIQTIGKRGYCIFKLTQRLLDPIPAGNCKLQTLRQFYRLPERGAHSALGDVSTVIDLISKVLIPIADERGLETWQKVVEYVTGEWYPTRISFGKFKGRIFRDAIHDREFKDWLLWLSDSKTENTAKMARWYLDRLTETPKTVTTFTASAVDVSTPKQTTGEIRSGLVLFKSVELEEMKFLVSAARERLADLEVIYARETNLVAITQSQLFILLKKHYLRRDKLRTKVFYRQKYFESLINGNEEPESVKEDYEKEKQNWENKYNEAEQEAKALHSLTEDQQAQLKSLYRKLVRLYHPDKHASNPEASKIYTRLTQDINDARNAGDIEKLKEIASDPEAYLRKLGLGSLNFTDDDEVEQLQRLYESIQTKILEMLELLDQLRADQKFELAQLSARRPDYLKEVATEYQRQIDLECDRLETEACNLAKKIEEITGENYVDDSHGEQINE